MTKLERLFAEYGQSPWLDNLTRGYLRDGPPARFSELTTAGRPVEEAYWRLVVDDITAGFVSVEVAAELARDTQATLVAARSLHERIGGLNHFVKIPATTKGVPAIQAMIAEGRSVNITLFVSRVDTEVGVDMDDVGLTLETQGVAAFHKSYLDVLAVLTAKAGQLSRC